MAESVKIQVFKSQLTARIQSMKVGATHAAAKATYEAMQVAFKKSQEEVPVLTGTLKNSGQLHEPELLEAGRARVAITYGGAASRYAQKQHDDVTLNHPNGGKAHFIIDPVQAIVPDLKSRLHEALKGLGGHS